MDVSSQNQGLPTGPFREYSNELLRSNRDKLRELRDSLMRLSRDQVDRSRDRRQEVSNARLQETQERAARAEETVPRQQSRRDVAVSQLSRVSLAFR